MKATEILPFIAQSVGFDLQLVEEDIHAYLHNPERYPTSYTDVMSEQEEMVGSMYSKMAFQNAAGYLVGLNFFDCGLTDEQLSFFADPNLKEGLKYLESLNLNKNKLTHFHLSQDRPELVFLTLNENPSLKTLTFDPGLKRFARLEGYESGIEQIIIPEGYESLYYVDVSQ